MENRKDRLTHGFICSSLLLASTAIAETYSVNTNVASGAKVTMGFDKNEGTDNINYGYDAYGTYLSGFPSINDYGDVAGRAAYIYIDPNTGKETTQWEAAVWINGEIHRFGVVNCTTSNCQSRAVRINNARDEIVGSSHSLVAGTTPYFERAIKWSAKNDDWLIHYGLLGYIVQSYIEDINDQGSIVGSAIINMDYIRHAQVIIDEEKYIIGADNVQSLGMAINNNNIVVGSISLDDSVRAFQWGTAMDQENPTILASLGGGYAIAYDINDSQVIVGAARNENNILRAVKWVGNTIYALGSTSEKRSIARSVNNTGTIVGHMQTEKGENHAFIIENNTLVDLNDETLFADGNIDDWVIVDAYTVNNRGQILVRAQKNRSRSKSDNAYWVLSPEGLNNVTGPEMTAGQAYCLWGRSNCEITYPPVPVENALYKLPIGDLPTITLSDVPTADAYVCNTNCEMYDRLVPQYRRINEAIKNTFINTSIVVLPGVYRESIELKSRKLIGLSREHTIINADGLDTRPVSLQGRSELHNLALTGGNALNGGGIQISGGFNLINNCIIQGNTASLDGGGVHGLMNASFELRNSIISQNKAYYGGGYLSWAYGNATIENNKFLNNTAQYGGGAFFSSYANVFFNANILDNNSASVDGGGAYVSPYTRDRYLRNSLITNNRADRYAAGVYRGIVLGSVVYGNEAGITKYSAILGTGAQNSIIWGNAGVTATRGIHDSIVENKMRRCSYCSNVISEDPLFVDAANGDFRLQENSPAIDNGGNTSQKYGQFQRKDFNGLPRGVDGDLKGSSVGDDYDIGAFEYIPKLSLF